MYLFNLPIDAVRNLYTGDLFKDSIPVLSLGVIFIYFGCMMHHLLVYLLKNMYSYKLTATYNIDSKLPTLGRGGILYMKKKTICIFYLNI